MPATVNYNVHIKQTSKINWGLAFFTGVLLCYVRVLTKELEELKRAEGE